jgi:hypothetical protein
MIRFGMKLPEIFNQLVRGYQKVRGQKPTGLDLIKIKQEAMLKFQEMRKVLDMQRNPIDPNKPIIGGKQLDKNAPGYFNDFTSMMIKDANVAPKVIRSGIMKTTEAMNPKFIDFTINSFKNMDGIKVMKEANKVIKREGPYKDLTKNDAKRIMDAVDDKLKNIDMDPEDMYADGGRIGLKDGEGIMKMASMEENEREFMRLVEEFMEQGFSQQEAIEEAKDTLERKSIATGGRAGFKDGEGIMQMASAPEPMDERNELSLQIFGKPIKLLTPEEMDMLNDEAERLMQKFSSAPDPMDERNMVMENIAIKEFGKPLKDLNEEEIIEIEIMIDEMTEKPNRGAQSIKLADGGITRVGLKDGLSSKLNKKFKIDGGTLRSMFFNKNNPILTGFNASELFDLAVRNIGPAIGLADGGRAAFKDGPKDPRRRGFMKAAVGVASMLPFGMGKIIKTAAPAIEKAADISGPALAKIVETVMSLGKTISQSGKRVKEMITKKKHKGVEVEEDIMDGSYTIKKGNKEIYFKPGRRDEMGIDDDIIEVIEKTVTKKAGGGVARLLGE